jgi:hypothetical protein
MRHCSHLRYVLMICVYMCIYSYVYVHLYICICLYVVDLLLTTSTSTDDLVNVLNEVILNVFNAYACLCQYEFMY